MKTDWEGAFNELWETCTGGNRQEIVARHTRRTEEDLPKNAWHWVRGPMDKEWGLAYFGRDRGLCHVFTLGCFKVDSHWYNEHRLELEIGPQIVPPGEGK